MIALLDVNLLVALAWPQHVHHLAAHRWFEANREDGWATCPISQAGFVRVSSNGRAIAGAKSPREALKLLGRIVDVPGHVFWTDATDLVRSDLFPRRRLVGHRQVTDAHLLAIALAHDGRLATLERNIRQLVPEELVAEERVALAL